MPVTESYWPQAGGRQGVNEVFAVKRKAPAEEYAPWCPLPPDNVAAKRQCMEAEVSMLSQNHPQQQQQEEVMEDANCNNNCSSMQDLNSISHTQPMASWPANPCGLPTTQPQHFQQQNDHLMDLCDETYNPQATAAAELQDACMTMDSDCVPDVSQYSSTHKPDCCRVGEINPNTARVKCFCKPSWEGVMSLRPYVSDIY